MWTAISLTDLARQAYQVIGIDTSPGWLVDFPMPGMNYYPDWPWRGRAATSGLAPFS